MNDLASVTRALEDAGVSYAFRKDSSPEMDLTQGGEVDLQVDARSAVVLDHALRSVEFHRFVARGHEGHLFYLSCSAGAWTKIDVRVAGRRNRRWLRAVPPSRRRAGPVVAVLGPDGAGKSTVLETLRRRLPVAITVVYLGERKRPRRNGAPSADPPVLKEAVWLVVRWLRQLRALSGAYARAWRGEIVVCDRHPIEVKVVRPRRTAIGARLETFLTDHFLPVPDRLVVLDASVDVLAARKSEHPVDRLRGWRDAYRTQLADLGPSLVSSEGSVEATTDAVSEVVWEALAERRGW